MQRTSRFVHLALSVAIALSLSLQGAQPAAAQGAAQGAGPVRTQHHSSTGKLSFVGAPAGQPIVIPGAQAPGLAQKDRALAMLAPYAADFGLKQADKELKVKQTQAAPGRQITRFQQTYQGIPVMAGELVVNADDSGGLLSINGAIAPDLNLSITPSITTQQAQQTALQTMAGLHKGQPADYQATQPALWIYDARLLQPDGTQPTLVWRMDVTSQQKGQPVDELVLVDAQRGNLLLHFNQVDTAWGSPSPAKASAAATTFHPLYFQIVLDEGRGWIYGSDSADNKVDVISASTLQLVKSFTLVSGAAPEGIALSPDGTQLAIAQSGASSILFLNPDTGATIATVIPNVGSGSSHPSDVAYGRTGRLYSMGIPGGSGSSTSDYIHVIDTGTHKEVSRSSFALYGAFAISGDHNTLYATDGSSLLTVYKFDISTDTIPSPSYAPNVGFQGSLIVDPVENLLFTDQGQVWTPDAKSDIGWTGVAGQVAYVPGHHAVAVATNTSVVFVSATTFYPLSIYSLPVAGVQAGPIVARSDGSQVYVDTTAGVLAVDLSSFPPGQLWTNPTGMGRLTYWDLVADNAHGVLYGSNDADSTVDVISMSTLQVINQVRLTNHAEPTGMDLSPDGSELAVAQNGASSIAFISTSTLQVTATAMVYPDGLNRPYDVIYGRAGRLYSTGNSGPGSNDYIHVIDTTTHTEIAKSAYAVRATPRLAISSDKNSLYVIEPLSSAQTQLELFNVSTDSIPNPVVTPANAATGTSFILLGDNTRLFTNTAQVWNASLTTQVGTFSPTGKVIEVPNLGAVAVLSDSTPGLISFVSRSNYSTIGSLTLPGVNIEDSMAVSGDNRLFISTETGVVMIVLSQTVPSLMSMYDGSGQWTLPAAAFPLPLQVKVVNVFGSPLAGIAVTFTAPGSGATATFSNGQHQVIVKTDANGIASTGTLTAGSVEGAYFVQASIAGSALLPVPFSLANTNVPIAISTYSLQNSLNALPGWLVCSLSQPGCTKGSNVDADNAELGALYAYQFYHAHFGRNSLDNAGIAITSTVQYGLNYPNAYWDGSQMVYGDGYPAALDVIGHELTHGVTQYTSNLFYYYQSGAIDESMSDVFGELMDRAQNGGTDNWLLGEKLPDGAVRSMSNPPLYGDPDKMTSQYYDFDPLEIDNGGVHHNSGINNKAAYLMVAGGTFNGKTVAAIGANKTLAIYYEANTHLLTSGSNYSDLYVDLYQACLNLVGGIQGITLSDCASAQNALNAVEMNLQPVSSPYPFYQEAPVCASGVPQNLFFDGFENGTANWTISDPRWQLDPPNENFVQSGKHALFGIAYPPATGDAIVSMTNSMVLPAHAYLRFAQALIFDSGGLDGGVLEYSVNNGAWQDAGPLMDFNPYNGTISAGAADPLHGRSAFVGESHGYFSTRLDLNSLAGMSVRFRWSMGLDQSGGSEGWWLDDVQIYTCAVPTQAQVRIGTAMVGSYPLSSGQALRESYAGLNGGPVQVSSADGLTKLVASERVIFPDGSGTPTSYSELLGFPSNQLTTDYWFAWYNDVNMWTQLRFANVGSADTTINVYLGTNPTPLGSFPLGAGQSTRVDFPGVNGGPIHVVGSNATVPIIVAERIIFWQNGNPAGGNTSYFELMGMPGNQLTTTYWIPWYNNVNMWTQLRFANPSPTLATTVSVYLGNSTTPLGSYSLAPGTSARVDYPGVNGGPLRIVGSNINVPIIAAERVIFWTNGVASNGSTSYSEMMAIPDDQLTNDYWFPSYSYPDSNTWSQVRFANPSSSQATTVQVYLAGNLLGGYTLGPGQSARVDYPGQDSGPLEVKTTDGRNIIVSLRVILRANGVQTSYSEITGFPANQLTTSYVFPWYNNVNFSTQLRIAAP